MISTVGSIVSMGRTIYFLEVTRRADADKADADVFDVYGCSQTQGLMLLPASGLRSRRIGCFREEYRSGGKGESIFHGSEISTTTIE